MGRPCKCCQNVEECTGTRVFNSKAIPAPNNPDSIIGFEDQWDILRGDPFIASRGGVLLGNPATQTLLVGYKQSMGDVIALHKTPMSTSKQVNILKLNASSPVGLSGEFATPGSFINLRSRASLNGQTGLRFAKPLPNEVGSERNFGDYLFFAKENSTGDFAEGWAIRVVVKCVKEINVRGLAQDSRGFSTAPEITKYGYQVDYQLFDTDGRKVANCLVYLPAYYDWSPFHGFNGEDAINALAPLNGATNAMDMRNKSPLSKLIFTEPTEDGSVGKIISQVDNSKVFDPDNGQQIPGRVNLMGTYADPNDMIGGILNNIYIESRCDSDYVQFWVSQPSNLLVLGYWGGHGNNPVVKGDSIYPSDLFGIRDRDLSHTAPRNDFEFLLFDHKIPDSERPGNRWGFRQAQGVNYEVLEENPETEQDGNPNIFRQSFENNTHASFNFKNALMTQGSVIGTGNDSILTGDRWATGSNLGICDPCYKSMTYGSNTRNLPTPIFKIIIEDFPEESYSNGAGTDTPNASYAFNVGYQYDIDTNLNGTYYVSNPASQGSVGCASKVQPESPASICGFRNMLLSLNAGRYTTYDSGTVRSGKFPNYDYKMVRGGYRAGGEISLDFFTPHIFFSGVERFIEYFGYYTTGSLPPFPSVRFDTYLQSGWYIEMAGLQGSAYSPYHQGAQGTSQPLSPVCRNASLSENFRDNRTLRQRYGFPIRAMFSNSETNTNSIKGMDIFSSTRYLDFIFENADFGDGTLRPALVRKSKVGGFYRDPISYSPIDRATIKIFMVSEEGE